MVHLQLIAAGHGVGLRLKRGEQLRLIDPHGGQSGDLLAFSRFWLTLLTCRALR
jgi:uncharacterized protein YcgI (DUF1989 family)